MPIKPLLIVFTERHAGTASAAGVRQTPPIQVVAKQTAMMTWNVAMIHKIEAEEPGLQDAAQSRLDRATDRPSW